MAEAPLLPPGVFLHEKDADVESLLDLSKVPGKILRHVVSETPQLQREFKPGSCVQLCDFTTEASALFNNLIGEVKSMDAASGKVLVRIDMPGCTEHHETLVQMQKLRVHKFGSDEHREQLARIHPKVGAHVKLHSLDSMPELDGRQGVVTKILLTGLRIVELGHESRYQSVALPASKLMELPSTLSSQQQAQKEPQEASSDSSKSTSRQVSNEASDEADVRYCKNGKKMSGRVRRRIECKEMEEKHRGNKRRTDASSSANSLFAASAMQAPLQPPLPPGIFLDGNVQSLSL